MIPIAVLAVLALALAAKLLLVDGAIGLILRNIFRNQSAVRTAWIGDGGWVALSRRLGLRYAIALVIASFAWIFVGGTILPDTEIGAWLLFGPSLLLLAAGVALGVLRGARWIADA